MFFSVKVPVKIGGKAYKTCICYDLTETLKSTVEKLVEAGKAEIYSELKFFCNGKIVEKKAVVKENLTTEKPKKEKKSKASTVKEEADTLAEEIDESEGF